MERGEDLCSHVLEVADAVPLDWLIGKEMIIESVAARPVLIEAPIDVEIISSN